MLSYYSYNNRYFKNGVIIMNKFYIFFLTFVFFTNSLFASIPNNQDKVYRVGVLKDWKPYYYIDENKNPQGFAIDIFEEVAKYSGIKYHYMVVENWKEAVTLLENGVIDILPNSGIIKTREKFIKYSTSVDTLEIGLFKRLTSDKINSIEDLYGKNVAVIAKNIGQKLISKYPQINQKVFLTHFDAIRALISGEVDGLCYPESLVFSALNQMGFEGKILALETPLHEVKRAIGVNKKHQELIPKINKGLEKLTQSKKYELIHNRWFTYKHGLYLSFEQKKYLENKKELTVCVRPNCLPYDGIEDGKFVGISADYLTLIGKKLGVSIKVISALSNQEVISLLNEKKCDIKPVNFVNKKREKLPYSSTKAYIEDYTSIVTEIHQPYFKNIGDYLNKKFVMLSYQNKLIESVEKKYPEIQIIKVDDIDKALLMVKNKRAFGFIGKSLSSIYHIQRNYVDTLKVLNEFERIDLGFGVIEDDTILFQLIEKSLNAITEKEKLKIRNNWAATTIEIEQDYTIVWQLGSVIFVALLIIAYLVSVAQRRQLQIQNKFTNNILDSQVNLTLITNGDKLYRTNQTTLDFLGYDTLEDFHKNHDCICDLFIKEEGYLYKEENGNLWYQTLLQNPTKDYFVKIKDTEDKIHIFQVNTTGEKIIMDLYYVITFTDITELSTLKKELEERIHNEVEKNRQKDIELLEHAKMASMGEMIGNIAHQWRQPLSVISTSASGVKLQKELGDLDDLSFNNLMDNIVNQAQYLSDTIDDFRNFIKKEKDEVEFTIQETIDSFLHLVEGSMKAYNIKIDLYIDENIILHGYPNELVQCFINIFNNSKDVYKDSSDGNYFFIEVLKKQNKCYIVFRDNGGGIKQKILPHIFEPYFTTKHQSQGTGLGLSMTYNLIVKSMKGIIKAKNITYQYKGEKYMGVEVRIILPIEL